MGSQLVNFPTHYLPPHPSEVASPLLQNPLLQSSFLLQHVLLPTLYSALTPQSFKNRTENQRIQTYLADNYKIINVISQNLTDAIKSNCRRGGFEYDEDPEETCRMKRNLGYSVTSSQVSLLKLQQTVADKLLKRRIGSEVESLLQSMSKHIETQKNTLEKIRKIQIEADKEDVRSKRTTIRCKDPFFSVGRECFYLGHKKKLGWHEAKAACHKLQAYLAEPEKPRNLARVLRKKKGQFNRCWIGGSDEKEEGNWKWLSGSSLVGDQNWRPGQPGNFSLKGEVQNCLVLVRHAQGPPLDDFSCWADRAYLCETQPEC